MAVSPRGIGALLVTALACAAAACGPSGNNTGTDGGDNPTCTPGDTEACYEGPPGTEGNGPCTGGTHTCLDTGHWGTCNGQVTPIGEVCGNGADDNCNGVADENVDADLDGFSTCAGDCCDSTSDGCTEPGLVNPGAFDAPGNNFDDDCDGTADNGATAACDSGLPSNSSDPMQYAQAMDLCQTASATDNRWGVLEAKLVYPTGAGTPNATQHAIRPSFGGTQVQNGSSLVVLSTGAAAATGQTAPDFVDFQGANPLGTSSGFPADWLALQNPPGNLPNLLACPEPSGTSAQDPVMLQLRIRTPTNAKSFSISTNFLSSEYPEWTCSPYNDFFVVLLDSTWAGTPANPHDKNLATYTSPSNQVYPVGVNLAYGDTGLFQQCENGATGCASGSNAGNITTCAGVGELAGTGMETPNPPPKFASDLGYCGTNNLEGGGTGWLVTQGNVVGGETIVIRIALWDTSDGNYDSVALIDNFQWSVDTTDPGTVVN